MIGSIESLLLCPSTTLCTWQATFPPFVPASGTYSTVDRAAKAAYISGRGVAYCMACERGVQGGRGNSISYLHVNPSVGGAQQVITESHICLNEVNGATLAIVGTHGNQEKNKSG